MHCKTFAVLMCFCLAPLPAKAAAIHDAAKKGDMAGIAAALDGGADVNQIDGLVTPLYVAAINSNPEAVKLLITHGADVNLPTKFGAPLHAAAQRGCLACVKLLVEAGADVNVLAPERKPAVHLAKKFGYSDVVDYLFKHGYIAPVPPPISTDLNSADPGKGKTLFLRGCSGCHDATTKMKNGRGPHLWNIVGRPKASIATWKYSQPLVDAGGSWDYEALNGFISDPMRVLPGTDMEAHGYQNLEDRADLIAYLRTLSDSPEPLPGN
jgi:cytochrome c